MPKRNAFYPAASQKNSDPKPNQNSVRDSFKKLKQRKPGFNKKLAAPKATSKVQYVKVLKKGDFYNTIENNIHPGTEFEFTDNPPLQKENGKEFYYAVSQNPQDGKYQSFKVFVIPRQPTRKLDFREQNLLSSNMHDYQWKAGKSGGKSNSGELGGQYEFRYVLADQVKNHQPPNPDATFSQTILFKQDKTAKIRHDKNITEYVAGRLMNLFGGDSAATTFLAIKPSSHKTKLPDLTGENIYVGSIYYDNYQDLFRDIERIHGRVPAKDMQRPRAAGSWNKSWFTHGMIDPATKLCRFHNFETVLGVSLLFADYDTQSENFGNIANRDSNNPHDPAALPVDANGNLKVDEDGKLGILVKIDHANALRDLEDEVHMDAFRFWITFSGNDPFTTQPTNHIREYPRILRVSPAMAAELDRISHFDLARVKAEIDDTINEVNKFYGVAPLLEFAEYMKADVAGHLRQIYGSDVIYNNIISGKYATAEPAELTAYLSSFVKDFLTTKMTKRMASLQQIAIDMKVSVCFKKVNGSHVLDPDSPYNLKDILNEHPEYIINDRFHFRASGQKGIIAALMNPFHHGQLKELAQKTSSIAAVDILRETLGDKVIGRNTSNYSVTFYKTEDDRKITPPIPVGVHHMVVSDSAFKHSIYYNKHKNSSPNISTTISDSASKSELKPGDYGLNFIDSSHPGAKALYIEKITETYQYQISAHRLPPEVNTRYIYRDVILKHLHPELLNADPSIAKNIQLLVGKLYSEDGVINDSKLAVHEKKYLMELLERNGMDLDDLKKITEEMAKAELDATTEELEFEGYLYRIPSQAYLDFAEMQCQSMMLRNGPDTVIEILPDPDLIGKSCDVKNPLLTQAYMLVCEKNHWKYENKTNVLTFTPTLLDCTAEYLREQARENFVPPSSLRVR